MSATRYDTIVIGAGQGGKPLAVSLANAGKKVALIEKAEVGGTCVNVGCTPTKTMVASARVAHLVSRAADYGIRVAHPEIDLGLVRDRKRKIVESFRSGVEQSIDNTSNLTLLRGEASFSGPKAVTMIDSSGQRHTLQAATVVIDTGTRNHPPSIPGAATVIPLDSTSIMELDTVPRHLIVVGGGYIGLEFGQMFRRFGSDVTILQRANRLLNREDDDVTKAIEQILTEDGIQIVCNARIQSVRRDGDRIAVELDGGTTIPGSHFMFATGRRPNTDSLHADRAGVALDDRGFVEVDERLQTTAEGIYAMGDVTGGPAFTHISYDDYRILEQNLLHGGAATTKDRLVPYTLFTDPQLGRVGLSEKQAAASGQAYRIAKIPMTHVARALETDETRGFMKALIDPDTNRILGCAILGVEGGEVMAVIQVAMMAGLPYTSLRDAAIAHPTLAESLNNLFAAVKD